MNWILEHLQILIGAAAAIAYFLNRQRGGGGDEERELKPDGGAATEQAERTRRVQEEIRRKIAERRGAGTPPELPSKSERIPPFVRPTHVPPVDPFGGPIGRVARKLEEAAAKLEQRTEDPEEVAKKAEVARQAKLAERLRELEQERALQEQRAVEISRALVAQKLAVTKEPSPGAQLQSRLRRPAELRDAVILREVLDRPVGLR